MIAPPYDGDPYVSQQVFTPNPGQQGAVTAWLSWKQFASTGLSSFTDDMFAVQNYPRKPA